MRIGELSTKSNVAVETLRYYEKRGLIESPLRGGNGYRDYSSKAVDHLRFIARAKQAGFSLKECKELLSIFATKEQRTCQDVKSIADHKLDEINHKMCELKEMQTMLHRISDACCGGDESAMNCTILEALEGQNDFS